MASLTGRQRPLEPCLPRPKAESLLAVGGGLLVVVGLLVVGGLLVVVGLLVVANF